MDINAAMNDRKLGTEQALYQSNSPVDIQNNTELILRNIALDRVY